jgi:hypothetical protein
MEFASYFINNKAMFGSYPTQDQVDLLELLGFHHFVDLTHSTESKIKPYTTHYNYINFPMIDREVPDGGYAFAKLIYQICEMIGGEHKVYIHCKGGHGRSGIVVACTTARFFNINVALALQHTRECHQNRTVMRDIWRNIGSPQTSEQRMFVRKACMRCNITTDDILHIHFKRPIRVNTQIYSSIHDAYYRTNTSLSDILYSNETFEWRAALMRTGIETISVKNNSEYSRELMTMRFNYFIT